jgi:hypothetical protein
MLILSGKRPKSVPPHPCFHSGTSWIINFRSRLRGRGQEGVLPALEPHVPSPVAYYSGRGSPPPTLQLLAHTSTMLRLPKSREEKTGDKAGHKHTRERGFSAHRFDRPLALLAKPGTDLHTLPNLWRMTMLFRTFHQLPLSPKSLHVPWHWQQGARRRWAWVEGRRLQML